MRDQSMVYKKRLILCLLVVFNTILLFYINWEYFIVERGVVDSSSQVLSNGTPLGFHATPVFYFDAAFDTLMLTKKEQQDVAERQRTFVSYNESGPHRLCPKRYLVARADTYGRHHNQLDQFMNIIMWAERFNRTAVLGSFKVEDEWVKPEKLYDFSKIAERYCVVTEEVMLQDLDQRGLLKNGTYVCYGLCLKGTPLDPKLAGMQLLDRASGLPQQFPWRCRNYFLRRVISFCLAETADVVVLGGQYAFLLHCGLHQHATVFGLLRPSQFVQKKVDEFLDDLFYPRNRYFAIHKRHRDGSCHSNIKQKLPELRRYTELRDGEEKQLHLQCNVSIPYLAALYHSLGLELFSFPLFLAHDSQDMYTVQQLAAQGARMYDKKYYAKFEDCEYGLCALAVDFFLLIEGEFFSGNVVSSVSHNVCFVRLGRGRTCHGMDPSMVRVLTRDTLEPLPHHPLSVW